jgi:hypothetical protein
MVILRRSSFVFSIHLPAMIQLSLEEAVALVQQEQPKITPSSFEQVCACCGHVTVAYRMKFRAKLIPALRLLTTGGKTLHQLRDSFMGGQAAYVVKYWAELRQWNLIQKTGDRWNLTPDGWTFLNGYKAIPEYVWQRDKGPLPEYCQDGAMKFIDQLSHEPDKHERIRVLVSDGRAA